MFYLQCMSAGVNGAGNMRLTARRPLGQRGSRPMGRAAGVCPQSWENGSPPSVRRGLKPGANTAKSACADSYGSAGMAELRRSMPEPLTLRSGVWIATSVSGALAHLNASNPGQTRGEAPRYQVSRSGCRAFRGPHRVIMYALSGFPYRRRGPSVAQ